MTKTQQKYLSFLAAVERVLQQSKNDLPILNAESDRVLPELETMQSTIRQRELLIPVVGAFSAGKSSLLNAIVKADLLSVAITPETAMPTELRYDSRQRLEVVFEDGRTEEFPLAALSNLQARAQEIKLIRLYADLQPLKALQPLVLVDMPGFNSPLDVHNRAIARYIGDGAHYLFVVSVEEGSLHTQSLRRIEEVVSLGRTFSVCLNKADLRPPHEVESVRQYIADQLVELGLESSVCAVSQHDTAAVQTMLETIQPDTLIYGLFQAPVQQLYQMLDAVLQTSLEALRRDHEGNEKAIAELQAAIREIEQQRDSQLSAARATDLSSAVERVLTGISNALNLAIDDMARAALRGQDELGRVASDEIRASLTQWLKRETDHLSEAVVHQFSKVSATRLHMDIKISEDWTSALLKGLQAELLPMLLAALGGGAGKAVGMFARLLSGTAVVGRTLPNPIMKIAALLLPSLLEHLLGQLGEGQKLEQAKKAIREQLIPDVLRGLRSEVTDFLTNANDYAVAAVAAAFEQQLQAQRDALAQAQDRTKSANKEGLHAAVLAVRTELQALAHAHQLI